MTRSLLLAPSGTTFLLAAFKGKTILKRMTDVTFHLFFLVDSFARHDDSSDIHRETRREPLFISPTLPEKSRHGAKEENSSQAAPSSNLKETEKQEKDAGWRNFSHEKTPFRIAVRAPRPPFFLL